MRKDNTTLEDKIKRAQELAGIKPLNESNKGNHVTLSYSEKIKNTNYGIVKEGGFYFIKSSNAEIIKESTDYNYIGGLANKNEYKYSSYADALKNLNMMKITITESLTTEDDEPEDDSNEDSEEVLQERLAQDIANDQQPPLAPGENPAPQQAAPAPMPTELPPAPQDAAPAPAPSPEGLPPASPDALPTDDSDLDGPDTEDDVDHYLGKLTYKIGETPEEELSDNKIKGILNSIISALPLDRLSPEERLVLAKRVKRGGNDKEGEQGLPQPEQAVDAAPAPELSPEDEQPIQENKYPWDKCEKDQEKEYGSKKVADKVCGAIKAKNMEECDTVKPDEIVEEGKVEVCNPGDEKKMNEFYSKIDKTKLVYENSNLKYKNVLLESNGKNTLKLSSQDKSYTFNVSAETIKKYENLINETRVLSESNIKLNKVIK